MPKETILIFSAHSDDFVIGAGGTIAEYTKQGKKVLALVFSYGELSHPWMKGHHVREMRSQETFAAAKLLKCKVIFFNLKEGKFPETYKETNLEPKLLQLLNKVKPSKIFTHSSEDPHPDHKAVHALTIALYEKMVKKPDIYIYSVWNPVSFRRHYPALYVDISHTFRTKLHALRKFHSQKIHVAYPLFLLLFRAIIEGFKVPGWLGEKFFKIR